jgi:anti-sigma regulatory factor (Ser/Thr protein kinase)
MTSRTQADITRVLSVRAESVGEARHTVTGLPLPQPTRDILALLASELMTNCIRHAGLSAGDLVRLHITTRAGRIRISLHDKGRGFLPPASVVQAPSLAGGGRGLLIVSELADDWGVEHAGGGCTVWCELEVDDEPVIEHEPTTGYVRELAKHIAVGAPAASPAG